MMRNKMHVSKSSYGRYTMSDWQDGGAKNDTMGLDLKISPIGLRPFIAITGQQNSAICTE